MSFKAKDLAYDTNNVPSFLRKLRGNYSTTGDADRHERPIARPKKAKRDDEDDTPTYVLEESNDTISKEQYEALVSGRASEADGKNDAAVPQKEKSDILEDEAGKKDDEAARPKQQVAEVGTNRKKRKIVKVADEVEEEEEAGKSEENTVTQRKPPIKPKKKAKAIKLSFGEDQ